MFCFLMLYVVCNVNVHHETQNTTKEEKNRQPMME